MKSTINGTTGTLTIETTTENTLALETLVERILDQSPYNEVGEFTATKAVITFPSDWMDEGDISTAYNEALEGLSWGESNPK